MSDLVIQVLVGLGIAAITAVGSILFADQRAKGRLEAQQEKHEDNAGRITKLEDSKQADIAAHAVLRTTVEMVLTQISRLDEQKASKEIVDGFRREITDLKVDMDRRFDKLERLITRLAGHDADV